VDLDPTRFENQVRVAEASLAAATTAESEIAVASSRLDVLNALLTEQTANQKRLEYALKETEKSQAVIGARVADRRAQIPDDHGSLAELNTLIAAEHIAHDKALSLAKKTESTAAALALACAASTSLAENTRKSVAHANQVSREAQLTFEARVAEAGFGDLDAYRAARLESDEIVSLEETLRQYDHDSTSAKGILDHLNEQLTGIEHPELDALRAMVIEARAKLEAVEADLLRMREAVSPMVRARQEIDELKKASAIREAEYGIMATLRDVAQGKGPNQSGIQFERYILAGLLDEVLVHATTRLRIMSDGRYTIQRKDPNRARTTIFVHDKRRETGLELEVVDTFTGKERDAGTLSGGEGFQASLSLALGLADVVQAQSGGIQLSAMFIDEGFGTQSEEALDAVLDTLTGLQASGRLVGFISHVKELKTRIPAQLHVHKTTTGSHVQWVIR
jgi:exonuclease SbcC